ncbi:hypothetical protein HMPREF1039_1625, partial [Megasphaera lornae]
MNDTFAKKDASNVTDATAWAGKLGTGKVEANNANLVTGKTVYDFVNPVKTQAETNKADIATLQKGFTLKDVGTGSKTVIAESTVTVTGDTYVKATVNDKGLTLGLNEDALNSQINTQITSNSTVTGKMSAWKLKANGVDGEGTVNNTDNTVTFDVAEANKGLTVTRDKNTIKYGINVDSLANNITSNVVTNINNGKTAIENISAKFSVTDGTNTKEVNLGKGKNNNVKFVGEAGKINVAVGGDNDAPTVTVGLAKTFTDSVANNTTNISNITNKLTAGFKLAGGTGEGNVSLGGETAPTVTFAGDANITSKVDGIKVTYSLNKTGLTNTLNDTFAKKDASNIDGTAKTNWLTALGLTDAMHGFKVKAGTGDEQAIKNGNTVTFDVAEADKGLTVIRDKNTIKYGINASQLASNITNNVVTNINNGKTAITNVSTGFTVSDGNNTPLAMEMTKDKKPNLQFVSKDENTEVTAEKTATGTKVTIGLSAAAQQGLANQDLNFAGTSGTGKVNLRTQTLSITGDADGIISTTATGQGLSMTVDKEKLASTVTNTINNNTNATAITNISAKFSVTDG